MLRLQSDWILLAARMFLGDGFFNEKGESMELNGKEKVKVRITYCVE